MEDFERVICKQRYNIVYSQKYEDDRYQYRLVHLPLKLFCARKAKFPDTHRPLAEEEWRSLKVQGGPGWENFAVYKPEPHIMLFRRPLEIARLYDPNPISRIE